MDEKIAKEIIAAGFNRATKGRVENVIDTAPDHTMTSEQIQRLHLTKESLIEAFLQDPRVNSANCDEGEFRILTKNGNIIKFKMVFADEHVSDIPNLEHFEVKNWNEDCADMLFDLYKNGVTVKDLLESGKGVPGIISTEYRDGVLIINTVEGEIKLPLPFFKYE